MTSKITVSLTRFIFIVFSQIRMLLSSWYEEDIWGVYFLLSGRKRGGHSIHLSLAFNFQVSLAQNNPYVKVAYFKVAYSVTLQYPPIKHQHVILPQVFFCKVLGLKHSVLAYRGYMEMAARNL